MHTRCSRTILKTLFSWGTSVTERIRLFSGTVAAVAEGKEWGKSNGSLSSMLPQIIKAFVCLDILASLCTGFCTASTSMICWWYDQLKVWKARLMCKRWSGLGKSFFFLWVQRKESKVTWLNILPSKSLVSFIYIFYSASVHLIDQKMKVTTFTQKMQMLINVLLKV